MLDRFICYLFGHNWEIIAHCWQNDPPPPSKGSSPPPLCAAICLRCEKEWNNLPKDETRWSFPLDSVEGYKQKADPK